MIRPCVLASALLLAACSGGGDGGEAGNNSADQAVTTTEPVPDNATLDPQNRVVPLAPAASPTPVKASGFPAPFQGRWALGEADCDPANADIAKGLMTIEAGRVAFYESRGTPTRIEQTAPQRLVAEIGYSGEGQTWTRRTTMTLTDAGKTLTAETPDDPEAPMRTLRYQRCPA